ncbi:MAG TPA: carbohydrate ABC transporter permease [Ktedonobacteraceae bacterium]
MQSTLQSQTSQVRAQRQLRAAWMYLILLALVVLFVAPFIWLVITALKLPEEMAAYPIHWFPTVAQWGNFAQAFTAINFPAYAANSVILAGLYAVLVTFSSSLVGFGFARLRGKGKRLLLMIMLSTLMLPAILTVIPTYVLFARLNLIDTYWPWVLWGLASSPFLAFLFRQFFTSIPLALEEAAILDGCSYFRIYWQIFLPLSLPVIATAFILSFTWTWGDYITPSLFLSQNNTTLAVAMSLGYTDAHGNILTNMVAAGSILYVAPVLLLFVFAQRFFVSGIVTSGVKV